MNAGVLRLWVRLFWGVAALPEGLQQVQECLCFALLDEDGVLFCLGYGHRNFGRVGVEKLNERIPFLGGGVR